MALHAGQKLHHCALHDAAYRAPSHAMLVGPGHFPGSIMLASLTLMTGALRSVWESHTHHGFHDGVGVPSAGVPLLKSSATDLAFRLKLGDRQWNLVRHLCLL